MRACVAMAWPTRLPNPDADPVLEEPRRNEEPGVFTHTDLTIENGKSYYMVSRKICYLSGIVMLGDFIPNEAEHRTAPILKIIDFGLDRRLRISAGYVIVLPKPVDQVKSRRF